MNLVFSSPKSVLCNDLHSTILTRWQDCWQLFGSSRFVYSLYAGHLLGVSKPCHTK